MNSMSLEIRRGKKGSVGIRATIYDEKLGKTRKKEHIDLMWFDKLPTSMRTRKKTLIMYQIRVK